MTEVTDAEIDLWNDAVLAAMRGLPCPADDSHSRDGYAYGLDARAVRVVMPERAEGYYHCALQD